MSVFIMLAGVARNIFFVVVVVGERAGQEIEKSQDPLEVIRNGGRRGRGDKRWAGNFSTNSYVNV
eukprot:scaffold28997_cov98-Skeletonema_dohrnii-CCMP3373.AAC.1